MQIDGINSLASVTLAGSLAMERLVVIFKTTWPWLASPKPPKPGESEMQSDRWRRRAVLSVAITASLITAVLIGEGTPWYTRTIATGTVSLPWYLFALMISGGSAFWTSVVGYASAAKDVRTQDKLNAQAAGAALAAATSGPPARVVNTL